jgi:hypothetical protein
VEPSAPVLLKLHLFFLGGGVCNYTVGFRNSVAMWLPLHVSLVLHSVFLRTKQCIIRLLLT